ncbi:MAG: sigma-70 family RNA polymerase sigma factor [Planctomycetota bacterium]
MSSESDIQRASRGDAHALQQLLAAQLPALRGFLRLHAGRAIRARESCSDLAQSVCREVLEDLDEFEYRGEAAFRHWLFRRAHRKLLRRAAFHAAGRRDVGRELPQAEASASDDAELLAAYGSLCTPSRELGQKEALARIEAAVDELPEAQREAVILHRLVGLSYAEIAQQTGRSEGAIRTNVYRGLADLAVRLSAEA